jgi:hypothetical protein
MHAPCRMTRSQLDAAGALNCSVTHAPPKTHNTHIHYSSHVQHPPQIHPTADNPLLIPTPHDTLYQRKCSDAVINLAHPNNDITTCTSLPTTTATANQCCIQLPSTKHSARCSMPLLNIAHQNTILPFIITTVAGELLRSRFLRTVYIETAVCDTIICCSRIL